jgi:mono/diheme cytochrome c family protein
MKARWVVGLGVVVALALAALATLAWIRRPDLPAAERGRRLAERQGCFGCHGPEGTSGTANPGRKDRTVPEFGGDVMMFADDPGEIREWIRDGVPAKRAKSATWQEERRRGTLRMPAFKRRLTDRQIDDLVAFVLASSGTPAPEEGAAQRGLDRAEALGCFGCHGPGGRLARPNAGSFKGYVPAWDGNDFPDLVRDRSEFAEWVENGVSKRFETSGPAMFFLRRAVLKMPAYRRHLGPGDVDTVWAYVQWLRQQRLAK